jgi:hypothetical protein
MFRWCEFLREAQNAVFETAEAIVRFWEEWMWCWSHILIHLVCRYYFFPKGTSQLSTTSLIGCNGASPSNESQREDLRWTIGLMSNVRRTTIREQHGCRLALETTVKGAMLGLPTQPRKSPIPRSSDR